MKSKKILAAVAALSVIATDANPQQITVDATGVFPESITADRSGAVIFGSLGNGGIYRAGRGETTAKLWIDPTVSGLSAVAGVYADDHTRTLYVCSVTFPPGRAKTGEKEAVRTFDLTSGRPKAAYPMPFAERSFCNDMALAKDGSLYIADTTAGAIHRLAKGGAALEVWVRDDRLKGADGIAVGGDGNVYVNTVSSGKLFRVLVGSGGSAAGLAELKTSLKLDGPDGLRALGGLRFLQAEGRAGRVALITVAGDEAKIKPILEGAPGVTGVTVARGKAWAVNARLAQMNAASPADGAHVPFTAVAIELPN